MALVALTSNTLKAPRRIEGKTSNEVAPIEYSELGGVAVGTLAAAATFIIPTEMNYISHVSITGTNAGGSVVVHAAPATLALVPAAIGAAALAGADTITLPSTGSAVNDVYNGCTVDIAYGSESQTLKILDYVGATKVATLDGNLTNAAATATTKVGVRGIIVTSIAGATTPSYSVEVIGQTL